MKRLPTFTGDGTAKDYTLNDRSISDIHQPNNIMIDGVGMRLIEEELEEALLTDEKSALYGVPVVEILQALDNPEPDFGELNEMVRYCHNLETEGENWSHHDSGIIQREKILCIIQSLSGICSEDANKEERLGVAMFYLMDVAGYLGVNLSKEVREACE